MNSNSSVYTRGSINDKAISDADLLRELTEECARELKKEESNGISQENGYNDIFIPEDPSLRDIPSPSSLLTTRALSSVISGNKRARKAVNKRRNGNKKKNVLVLEDSEFEDSDTEKDFTPKRSNHNRKIRIAASDSDTDTGTGPIAPVPVPESQEEIAIISVAYGGVNINGIYYGSKSKRCAITTHNTSPPTNLSVPIEFNRIVYGVTHILDRSPFFVDFNAIPHEIGFFSAETIKYRNSFLNKIIMIDGKTITASGRYEIVVVKKVVRLRIFCVLHLNFILYSVFNIDTKFTFIHLERTHSTGTRNR